MQFHCPGKNCILKVQDSATVAYINNIDLSWLEKNSCSLFPVGVLLLVDQVKC